MITKAYKLIFVGVVGFLGAATLSSCEDFFDQDSDHVLFADKDHLNNATDTIYSVTGIMSKMQALADRTILLGEARGDLVDVTDATAADLRNVALFDIDDDNIYNQPRDYYAVINNCNYFLAHVDTTLRNSRNEEIFKCEMTAVKCYRAWTYLQLAINYGRVPFVTEPILTKEAAEVMENQPLWDIESVCDWLINDLTPLADLQYMRYDPYTKRMNDVGENPLYGDIGYKTPSSLFYFPTKLLLGELNLWAGHYKEAAMWYYRFISERNGTNSTYPTGVNRISWSNTSWTSLTDNLTGALMAESGSSELITMIPGDSIPYNGNYLQLRNIFNSTDPVTREYHEVSLVPSQGLQNLSAAQTYSYITENQDTVYAPKDLGELMNGDLRLLAAYSKGYTYHQGNRVNTQAIYKYQSRNAHIWRRTMVWLHLAEALNCAGYPRFAYQILSRGVNNTIIRQEVLPYYSADSTWLKQFDFPATASGYIIYNPTIAANNANTQGIHTRGTGCAYMNKDYVLPDDTLITDSLDRIAYQQKGVEKMLIDEGALEFAFEGQRYYDLLRYALRHDDATYLTNYIYARRGEDKRAEVESEIVNKLDQKRNWFLRWKDKIGY